MIHEPTSTAPPEGRVIILEAERATLEIVEERHAERIEEIEVGRRVSGELWLALGMPDSEAGTTTAQRAGGVLPIRSPARLGTR